MYRLIRFLTVLSAFIPAVTGAQSIAELDRIVAVVNSDVIVASELNGRLREIRDELRQNGTVPPDVGALRRQVLERLILNRLQLQIAEKNGLRVEDDELNETIERIAASNELSFDNSAMLLRMMA